MMNKPDFPISLDRVIFTRSVVISVQGHNPNDDVVAIPPENDISVVPIDDEPGKFLATMTTKMNLEGNKNCPYIIDMECLGIFRLDDKSDEEARTRGLMIVAHSVLYGAIREAVAWSTSRQAFGALSLGLSILQSKKKVAES